VLTLKQAPVALIVLGTGLVFGCTSATSDPAAEADLTSSAEAYGMGENAQPRAPGNATVEDPRQDLQDPQQTAQQAAGSQHSSGCIKETAEEARLHGQIFDLKEKVHGLMKELAICYDHLFHGYGSKKALPR
jgi:hypothetical protein